MTTCYSIRIFKARLLESKLSLDYEQVFICTEKVITWETMDTGIRWTNQRNNSSEAHSGDVTVLTICRRLLFVTF